MNQYVYGILVLSRWFYPLSHCTGPDWIHLKKKIWNAERQTQFPSTSLLPKCLQQLCLYQVEARSPEPLLVLSLEGQLLSSSFFLFFKIYFRGIERRKRSHLLGPSLNGRYNQVRVTFWCHPRRMSQIDCKPGSQDWKWWHFDMGYQCLKEQLHLVSPALGH